MYKSKLTSTIKYSLFLLVLICVFQIPTKASAAISIGTDFDDSKVNNAKKWKCWVYIKNNSEDTSVAYVQMKDNLEMIVNIDGTTMYITNTAGIEIFNGAGGGKPDNQITIGAITDDIYIAYGGEGLRLIVNSQLITDTTAEPLTPTPVIKPETDSIVSHYGDVVIYCVSKIAGLFTEFPLNIIAGSAVIIVVFGFLASGKRVTR